MFKKLKENWKELKEAEPGRRFQERHERRQRESEGKFNIGKLVNILVGLVITAAGILLVPAPGPGTLVLFLGLGFIGSEFEPMARGLDWLELRVRAFVDWAKGIWQGAPFPGKLVIGAFLLACAAGFVFSGYQLFFGDSGSTRQ